MKTTSYVLGDSCSSNQSVSSNFTSFCHHGHGHDTLIMYILPKLDKLLGLRLAGNPAAVRLGFVLT